MTKRTHTGHPLPPPLHTTQQEQRTTTAQITQKVPRTSENEIDDKDGYYIIRLNRDLTPRYKILKLLGQGTFGKVVECWDRVTKTHVAVKIIRAVAKYRDAAKVELRVLAAVKHFDNARTKHCIQLITFFEHENHICMVFPLLSLSLFDFLRSNNFQPYPLRHIIQFARQLLISVAYLHEIELIHTDLKPENILLEEAAYTEILREASTPNSKKRKLSEDDAYSPTSAKPARLRKPLKTKEKPPLRMLNNTKIVLIDFGSATPVREHHSSVVSTRHYRAPEIILKLGWTFPCDMWSIGCILVELFTGEALFSTHDDLEHLKIIEIVVGGGWESLLGVGIARGYDNPHRPPSASSTAPPNNAPKIWKKYCHPAMSPAGSTSAATGAVEQFFANGRVNWPHSGVKKAAKVFVEGTKSLEQIIQPELNSCREAFLDIVRRMLILDPRQRMTARQALQHPFICQAFDKYG